jgi:hypothetical protein
LIVSNDARKMRNNIRILRNSTFSDVATESEAKEILVQASHFYAEVEGWIAKTHPALKSRNQLRVASRRSLTMRK